MIFLKNVHSLKWNTSENLGKNVDRCTRPRWTDTSMCLHLLQPSQCNHAHYRFNVLIFNMQRMHFLNRENDKHLFVQPPLNAPVFQSNCSKKKKTPIVFVLYCMFVFVALPAITHTDSNVQLSASSHLTRGHQDNQWHGIMLCALVLCLSEDPK